MQQESTGANQFYRDRGNRVLLFCLTAANPADIIRLPPERGLDRCPSWTLVSLGLSIWCPMFKFTQNPPEAARTSEASQPAKANATPLPRRYYLAAAALILLTALPTLLVYPQLPSVVPLQGETNAFGPKWSLFLYTPALMIGILLMFIALPRISVRRFQMNSSQPSYLYVMIVIFTLLSYSQILVLLSGLGWNVNEKWGMAGGVCLLIVLLGNALHKMRRNLKADIKISAEI